MRRRNSRQKFPTLIEKFHVFHDYATRKGMDKPHVNKSIQYMKLIGNQSLFHMVWFIFTLVLYIFTSLTIHDGTLCWELCNFPKLALCRRSLQHGRVWSDYKQNNLNQIWNIYVSKCSLYVFTIIPPRLTDPRNFIIVLLVTREPEQTTLLFWSAACSVTPHGLHTADRR